jgi:hypothetical protein
LLASGSCLCRSVHSYSFGHNVPCWYISKRFINALTAASVYLNLSLLYDAFYVCLQVWRVLPHCILLW